MSQLEQLQDAIRQKLPELDMVIAWGTGFDPLHTTPLFIRNESDLEHMTWGPLCVHNLATYLPGLKGNDERVDAGLSYERAPAGGHVPRNGGPGKDDSQGLLQIRRWLHPLRVHFFECGG